MFDARGMAPPDRSVPSQMERSTVERSRPFLRWAGGKQFYLKDLLAHLTIPGCKVFYEPFLGGASVALTLPFDQGFLSDINAELINCYCHVRDHPIKIANQISVLGNDIDRDGYNIIRTKFNAALGQKTFEQAVRFILLNRTSFNGIYRVNIRGEYNVPFGKPNPFIPTAEMLQAASRRLRSCHLEAAQFDFSAFVPNRGELLYLDPPYPQISETAYFRHYASGRFSDEMQQLVAEYASAARHRGVFVVISNADTPFIRKLYSGWKFFPLEKTRFVSCKRSRMKVNELIIRSY